MSSTSLGQVSTSTSNSNVSRFAGLASPSAQTSPAKPQPNFKNITIRQTARKFTARPPPPRPYWSKPAYYCDYNSHESITTSLFESDVVFSQPVLESLFFPNKYRNGYNFRHEQEELKRRLNLEQVDRDRYSSSSSLLVTNGNGRCDEESGRYLHSHQHQQDNNHIDEDGDNESWPKIISVKSESKISSLSSADNCSKPKLKKKSTIKLVRKKSNLDLIPENPAAGQLKIGKLKVARKRSISTVVNGNCVTDKNAEVLVKKIKREKNLNVNKALRKLDFQMPSPVMPGFQSPLVQNQSNRLERISTQAKKNLNLKKARNVKLKQKLPVAKLKELNRTGSIQKVKPSKTNTRKSNVTNSSQTKAKPLRKSKVQKPSPSQVNSFNSIAKTESNSTPNGGTSASASTDKLTTADKTTDHVLESISSTISKCRQMYKDLMKEDQPNTMTAVKNITKGKSTGTKKAEKLEAPTDKTRNVVVNAAKPARCRRAKKEVDPKPLCSNPNLGFAVAITAKAKIRKKDVPPSSLPPVCNMDGPLNLTIANGHKSTSKTTNHELIKKKKTSNINITAIDTVNMSDSGAIDLSRKQQVVGKNLSWSAAAKAVLEQNFLQNRVQHTKVNCASAKIKKQTRNKKHAAKSRKEKLLVTTVDAEVGAKNRRSRASRVAGKAPAQTTNEAINLVAKKNGNDNGASKTPKKSIVAAPAPLMSAASQSPRSNSMITAVLAPELSQILTQSPKEKTPEITIIQNCNANNCKQLRKLRSSTGAGSPSKRSFCPCECELRF